MVNRYQEPYLFALSPISSIRSFAWALEEKGTQEGRQLEGHHTSTHILGVDVCMLMYLRIYGDYAVNAANIGKQVHSYCALIQKDIMH